jgi:hypothetical protein
MRRKRSLQSLEPFSWLYRIGVIPKEAECQDGEGGGATVKSLRTLQHKRLTQEMHRVRREAGLTQAALAERLGVAQSYVAKVEGAERRLDMVEFMLWLRACDATEQSRSIIDQLAQMGGENGFNGS